MNSIDIITMKKTIKDYIDGQPIPKEVSRLVLKELLEEVSKEALDEAMAELEKGGKEDGGKPKETEE